MNQYEIIKIYIINKALAKLLHNNPILNDVFKINKTSLIRRGLRPVLCPRGILLSS